MSKKIKKREGERIGKLNIEEFLTRVGSKASTPGGGAVAAITGAIAVSLVEMVCNLTLGKKGYEEYEEEIKKIKNASIEYKRKLLELADEDIKAFNEVMDAYKAAKHDPEEKEKIQRALKRATGIPLETGELSRKVGEMAEKIFEKGNKNAASDAKTARYLADAAVKSALENVKINLRLIKDTEWKKIILPRVAQLQ